VRRVQHREEMFPAAPKSLGPRSSEEASYGEAGPSRPTKKFKPAGGTPALRNPHRAFGEQRSEFGSARLST
jgi:hypothetical protein